MNLTSSPEYNPLVLNSQSTRANSANFLNLSLTQGLNIYVFTMFIGEWSSLLVDGLIIAFIGLLEGLAIAQAFGKKNRYEVGTHLLNLISNTRILEINPLLDQI